MQTTWAIVEGESWRVLRVRGGRVEVFEVVVTGRELVGGRPSPPAPLPGGEGSWKDGQMCPSYDLVECLKLNGYRGEGVFLGLAAWRAAVGVIEPELEEVRRDPQALAIVLENELPWAAEEFVADFVPNGRQFLGVAVPWGELKELVQGLEDAGVWVQSIGAWSLVQLQGLMRGGIGANQWVVLAEGGNASSLLALRGGRLVSWEWLPSRDVETLRTRMGLMLVREADRNVCSTDVRWVYVGVDEATQAALSESVGASMRIAESADMAASQVRRILAGKERPWVEWRRGALADSRPYRSVRGLSLLTAIMGLVAMGLLIAAIRVRAGQYESQAMALSGEQTKLFHELLPRQKVPVGVRIRLESELVKLKAERGNPEAAIQLVSTPEILEHCVAALPESIRLRVRSIEVNGSQVTLDCETLSLSDSAILVDALNLEGFEVTAPRTELVGGLVPLKLLATWKGKPVADESVSKQVTP